MDKGQEVAKQFEQLKNQRLPLEHYWKDAFRYTLPHRGQKFISGNNDPYSNAQSAKTDQATIYDTTAIDAVRLLASSTISSLTPTNSQWFTLNVPGIEPEQLDYESKQWLQATSKKLYRMIHTSNYNAAAFEFFQDMAIGGMDCLYVEKNERGFKFEVWTLDSLFVADSTNAGRIDTVFRVFSLTANQASAMFGKNKLPDSIKALLGKPQADTEKCDYIHAIRPRKNGKPDAKLATEMEFESTYVHQKSATVVKESGYHEFPSIIPRWSLIPETPYALGPLNDCLPDVKTINRVREMMLSNAEMAIAGTFIAENDGVLNPKTTKIQPRSIIYANSVNSIKPLTTGGNFQIAEFEIQNLRAQIKSVMMADELSPIQKDYASATEVQARAQIIRQILGPVYARMQSEFLEPLLERTFKLAYRDGEFGQVPDLIAERGFIPEYTSPMAMALRESDIANIERFENSIAQTAQIFPELLDLYDAEQSLRIKAALFGVPVETVRTPEQVTVKREQEAKAQQQQQAQAMAAEQAMQQAQQ